MTPFRCIQTGSKGITADLNHPLAGIPLTMKLEVGKTYQNEEERGGSCTDWIDLSLSGPGMQTRYEGKATDFFSENSFKRQDCSPDTLFYETDRFVPHIDRSASRVLSGIYQSFLTPASQVLDLMAGWQSHLPENYPYGSVHGLGLNENELKRNTSLSSFSMQDLNKDSYLDFDDHSFDLIVCSLSVEYLTEPLPVFREAARILKPGGHFIVSFSNRWFPEKAIQIWKDLHDFEKIGLVIEYFQQSGRLNPVSTLSVRGFPRPHDDRYFPELMHSDPVFTVIFNK